MAHHVLKHGVLRVPLINALNELPRSLKVLDDSLPDHLRAANLATRTDLSTAIGVSEVAMKTLIAEIRADVIEEVQGMLAAMKPQGYVFKQDMEVAQAILQHDFDRDGPVSVTLFSQDYSVEYENFEVFVLNRNTVQLGFDEPVAFNALVL